MSFYIINRDCFPFFCTRVKISKNFLYPKYGDVILTATIYCGIIKVLLILCVFLPPARRQAGLIGLGAIGFALHTITDMPPCLTGEEATRVYLGFVRIVSGRSLPICGGIRWRFCFQHGETIPDA